MAKHTVEINFDKFTAKIVNSNRSKLGKRGITGGVEVDFKRIPAQVITNLLIDAVTAYLQVGVKGADFQETATVEDCQAAMNARLEMLYNGVTSAPGKARKAPTRDPIVAAAKASIKKSIADRSEEKLDGRVLTAMVSEMFKAHKDWVKRGRPTDDAKASKVGKVVDNALAQAKAAHEQSQAMADSLASLAKTAARLSAEAASKKAESQPEAEAKPKAKAKAR